MVMDKYFSFVAIALVVGAEEEGERQGLATD
jgi:hypothetical protein